MYMGQYDNLSKEELLKLIKKQELDLKSKKYGLVWDDEKEPEQVVLDCRDNLPILRRIKGKEIKEPKENTQEDNILIEGDNYHALTVLNYTHQEKIDVIYIDPPYNTGNKDFKYNDCYVDKEDGYKHSKWLNFMEKRLKLAKSLLKEKGVIFISIDDNEMAQLKLLCDNIFGFDNFLSMIIWNKKNVVQNDAKFSSTNHEYILSYRKSPKYERFELLPRTEEMNARYSNPDNDKKGVWTSVALQAKSGSKSNLYEIEFSNGVKWKPVAGTFPRLKKTSLQKAYDENRLWFGKSGKNVPRLKKYLSEVKQGVVSNSIWLNSDVGSTQMGKEELKRILGLNIFETPKPKNLITRCINLVTKNKNALILDFMAGSGTTGHSVLELNREDKGNRKFILCTNNENNICTEVTHPRIANIIKGYKKNGDGEVIKGLGGNLQYFKTSLIQTTKNRDQTKINLTQKCTEMLCLKENIFNVEIEEEDFKIFSSNKKDKFLCVYHNFIDESFENFINKLKELKGNKIVYMFSLEDKIDKSLFKEVQNYTLEAIPKKILEIYKKLIKMNIPIKAETIFIDLDKAKKQVFDDKDKDTGAKTLRVVLEKLVQKIAQKNQINILTDKGKEIKLSTLNDTLKTDNLFSKLEWEENKTYLTIGNHASHGEYNEFDLTQVNKFYKHVQTLINKFNI